MLMDGCDLSCGADVSEQPSSRVLNILWLLNDSTGDCVTIETE